MQVRYIRSGLTLGSLSTVWIARPSIKHGILAHGELARGLPGADDLADLRPPAFVQHLAILGGVNVAQGPDPHLDPQGPLVQTSVPGQEPGDRELDHPPEPVLRARDAADLAGGPEVELVVGEREGLGEQPVLRVEVVQDESGRNPRSFRDVGDPCLRQPALGDDPGGRIQDLLVPVLALLGVLRAHRSPRLNLGQPRCRPRPY
jgi:hypothetical protein